MKEEVIDILKKRRSVRNYQDKKINKEVLEDIVDCGRLAPTGYNNQPWTFLVITDKNKKDKLANIAQSGSFIKEAGACIVVFCDKDAETGLEDACAATENMMIAARAYGLETCWINTYKKDPSEDIKKFLNCPQDQELMTMFAVGYSEGKVKAPSKKDLKEVIAWQQL